MSTPYIIYGGIDSREIGGTGVIMEKLPDFHRPPRNVELLQVSGGEGRLEQDEDTYDVYTTDMKVNCNGLTRREMYAWLCGAGWLISSDEPDRAVWVSMHMQAKDSRFRADEKCYDTLTVTLWCQPYRYFYPDLEVVTITSSPSEIENPGTRYSKPIITIEGSGDVSVTLGDCQMDFEGLTDGIIVDSDLEDCFTLDMSQLLNGIAAMDEYPRLEPGANYIKWSGTGTISKITVERRCRDV